MIIIPADGLAFLISAIIENLLFLIFSSIFSLKSTKVLFALIKSFKDSDEIVFLSFSIFSVFFCNYFFESVTGHFVFLVGVYKELQF